MKWGVLTGALVLALHGLAAAAPPTYTLALDGTAAAPTSTPEARLKSAMVEAEGFKLSITCGTNLDCTKVKVQSNAIAGHSAPPSPTPDAPAARPAVTFTIPAAPAEVLVSYDALPDHLFKVKLSTSAAPPPPPPAQTQAVKISELAATPCAVATTPDPRNEVVVTPRGSLLSPPPAHFSEADTLVVTVVGDERLVNAMLVKRKSAFRTVTHSIQGEGEPRLVLQAAQTATCIARKFHVGDLAPGAGEIELSASLGAESAVLGSFQILVEPVYVGMFSVGAVWTPLLAPEFGVATRDGQQIITQSDSGDRRMAYALMFTPFLWEGLERNPRRPLRVTRLHHYLNPSVGFLLNDPLDNIVVGATIDIKSTLLLTAGALFSRTTRLDGVAVGQPFEGAAADLPTTRTWDYDWFVGVSVDLRVGVKLLRAVLGTAATGGS